MIRRQRTSPCHNRVTGLVRSLPPGSSSNRRGRAATPWWSVGRSRVVETILMSRPTFARISALPALIGPTGTAGSGDALRDSPTGPIARRRQYRGGCFESCRPDSALACASPSWQRPCVWFVFLAASDSVTFGLALESPAQRPDRHSGAPSPAQPLALRERLRIKSGTPRLIHFCEAPKSENPTI
jgi:hypothetical protein